MLISETYRSVISQAHREDERWGTSSPTYALLISKLINTHGIRTVLDYGCGKGRLAEALDVDHQIAIYRYDIGIPELSKAPRPCELVVCTDVLEHVEPDCIDAVLDDIRRCAKRIAFIAISLVPARKILPDGRNAHIMLRQSDWWIRKLLLYFDIGWLLSDRSSITFVATRKDGHNNLR